MSDNLPNNTNASADDRNVVMLTHLSVILFGFLGSLVVWLMHKDKPEKAFVSEQAKEALNFQITVLIAYAVSSVLMFILIGFLLVFAIVILNLVFCILAGVAASNGQNYRYPFSLRLLK